MIFYFLKLKLLNQLRQLKQWQVAGSTLLLTLVAGFYAVGFVFVMNRKLESLPQVFYYLAIGLFMLTISRRFLPSYKPVRQILPAYFPVSSLSRFTLFQLTELTAPYFWYMVFAFSIILLGLAGSWFYILGLLLTLINAQLVITNLQYLWEAKLKPIGWVYSLGSVVVSSLVLYFSFSYLQQYFAGYMLGLLLINVVLAYLVFSVADLAGGKGYGKTFEGYTTLKLVLNNRPARISLLVGMVFKIGYIAFALVDDAKFTQGFMVFIFTSPVILFTYVYNNTLGYWRNLWLSYAYRTSGAVPLMLQHVKLMLPLLVIDLFISVSGLFYKTQNISFTILFYLGSLLACIGISFLAIILFPIKIKQAVSMKANTSPWASFSLMVACALLIIGNYYVWVLYILVPLYLLGAWASWQAAKEAYPGHMVKLHQKLLSK